MTSYEEAAEPAKSKLIVSVSMDGFPWGDKSSWRHINIPESRSKFHDILQSTLSSSFPHLDVVIMMDEDTEYIGTYGLGDSNAHQNVQDHCRVLVRQTKSNRFYWVVTR